MPRDKQKRKSQIESVREALIALEVEGYVDVRPGSGVFVTTPKRPASDYSRTEGPLNLGAFAPARIPTRNTFV